MKKLILSLLLLGSSVSAFCELSDRFKKELFEGDTPLYVYYVDKALVGKFLIVRAEVTFYDSEKGYVNYFAYEENDPNAKAKTLEGGSLVLRIEFDSFDMDSEELTDQNVMSALAISLLGMFRQVEASNSGLEYLESLNVVSPVRDINSADFKLYPGKSKYDETSLDTVFRANYDLRALVSRVLLSDMNLSTDCFFNKTTGCSKVIALHPVNTHL